MRISNFALRICGVCIPQSETCPGRAGIRLPQLEHRLVAGEKQRVAGATRQESHLRIGLPAVLLELQR
jgi:hypothetical protein